MTTQPIWCWYLVGFASITVGLVCESYNLSCDVTNNSSQCSSLRQCDQVPGGVKPACFASFGSNNQGKLQVITKGCAFQNNAKCLRSSDCQERQRIRTRRQNRHYCCCYGDLCNRDVTIFAEEGKRTLTKHDAQLKVPSDSPYVPTGATESNGKLCVPIWVHVLLMTSCIIIMGVTVMVLSRKSLCIVKKQRQQTQTLCLHQHGLNEVVRSAKGTKFHWKKEDFQLITCLVRSKYGEIWQARLRGCSQDIRIRLTAGSDDVYVYDKHSITSQLIRGRTTA